MRQCWVRGRNERLKELERPPSSVGMSPVMFREDVWDVKQVGEGFVIRKILTTCCDTTLRFNRVVTSDVFMFTAKLTGLLDKYIAVSCWGTFRGVGLIALSNPRRVLMGYR